MKPLELGNLIEIAGGDQSFVLDMLRIYLKNLPGMIDPLSEAFEKTDVDGVIRWSHKLKSASGAAGAVMVLQHADIIEQMAIKDSEFKELMQQFEELQESIAVTKPAINEYLASH
jgi:HPt (histidine-containing phosphotransfer) domain-containing protein